MSYDFSTVNAIVIDTNSSMRQIMISMLRTMGMKEVIVANNEKQCIDLIASENINLVICGWTLPKLNALSILKKLRENDRTIQIPFVIVSTMIEQEHIKEAIDYGVSEYLVPPFNQKSFEERISKSLKIPIQQSAKNITERINAKRFTAKKDNSQLNVLIVDDVRDNIEIISALIKDKYKVKAALNAKTAMKLCISDSPPDLLLLDIMMPDVNGLTLCKQLKANPLTQNIVVIFLTALSETSDIVKGLSLGAVDYITKPIIPEILRARIDVHSKLILNQRSIQKQIDELLHQNSLTTKYRQAILQEFNAIMALGNEALSEVNHLASSKRQLVQPISELKYTLGMCQFITDKARLLDQLEKQQYKVHKKHNKLSDILLPAIDVFDFLKTEKNIERLDNIPNDISVNCDHTLLTTLFNCLYKNALEAAPRGSKVAVSCQVHSNFILTTIHNVSVISESVIDTFTERFKRDENKKSAGIGVYLAYLAIKPLQGELYYHSSEKFGTRFYIKLPI